MLTPRDFGLAAMVWVFLGFALMFADSGLSAATVQRRNVTPNQLSTVHWTNIAVACVVAIICSLGTPLWVTYYHEPALANLVPWAALTFVVGAFGQQFQAVAQRELQFQRMAMSDTLGVVAGFLASIIAAFLGAGVYSLIFGGLISATVKAGWISITGWRLWRPSWHWKKGDLTGLLGFGGFQIGDRTLNYIWNNADYMLIGRLLGSDALGLYRLAFETVVRPLETINPIVNKISYPVFAIKQTENAVLRKGFLEIVRFIASAVSPMMAGLCAVAPWAVAALFGAKWSSITVLLQILSPYGLLRALLNPTALINVANGRIRYVFCLNLTLACVLPLGFWFSARYGLLMFCLTEVLLLAIVMILAWRPLHRSSFGLSAGDHLLAVAKPVILSLSMGVCVYGLSLFLPASWSPVLTLCVLIGAGICLYCLLLTKFDLPYLRRVMRLVRGDA